MVCALALNRMGVPVTVFEQEPAPVEDQRAASLHPASFFLNVADTGQELRTLLGNDQTMFVWCDEVQLYWLANKRPPATSLA